MRSRFVAVAVFAAALCTVAHAQIVSQALHDFKVFLSAASNLVLQASAGLDKADFQALSSRQRESAATALQKLDDDLSVLFMGQSSLTGSIDFFIRIARDPARSESERRNYWNSTIMPSVQKLNPMVIQIGRFVEDTEVFTVLLTPEERIALRDNLRMRGIVLKSFERMSVPGQPDELVALEGINVEYKVLIANLQKLRVAVVKAQSRLKAN